MDHDVSKMLSNRQIEMTKAVREGNLYEAMACHAQYPQLYLVKDSLGCAPVFVACSQGHDKIVEWMLSLEGIDIFASDKNDYNPLHAASSHGHLKVVNILLREGFSSPDQIDRVGFQGFSPFFVACIFDNLEIAKSLLRAGADINKVDKKDNTALLIACKVGKINTVMFLVEEGANTNLRNSEGFTALQIAEFHFHKDIVNYLKNHGVGLVTN
jgi:uncharacterized protein